MKHRREEDRTALARIWAKCTPWLQIGGWLAVAIPSGLSLIVLIGRAEAFDGRLTTMEQAQFEYARKQEILVTKMDTVIYLVRKR